MTENLYPRLHNILVACGPFQSSAELRDLFSDERLQPWQDLLPHRTNQKALAQAVVALLQGRFDIEGNNALLLFLDVLSEGLHERDICRNRLRDIAAELSRAIETQQKPRIGAPRSGPLPLQRPPHPEKFTGCQVELSKVLDELHSGRVVTLHGPGGIGKSAIAAEVIWQLAPDDEPPQRFPDGIVFHSFYDRPQADLALEHLAASFGETERGDLLGLAQRALAGRRALVLLDGAEAADDLRKVLRVCGSCGVLVTSRRRQDARDVAVEVKPLPEHESIELLQKWAGSLATDRDAAAEIGELVGHLPLALRLVGRYLHQHGETAGDYLQWLGETTLEALDHGERREESVPLLIERSFAGLGQDAREALAIAGLLAFASFSRNAAAAGLDVTSNEARKPLGELVSLGLLEARDGRYQAAHALIHRYASRRLPPPEGAAARLATYLGALIKEKHSQGAAGHAQLAPERPHILALLQQLEGAGQWKAIDALSVEVQDFLDVQGYSIDRVVVCEAGRNAAHELGDRRTEGFWLGQLGNVYADLGQVQQAIDYYEQALAISQKISDRRGEGYYLGNLGSAYRNLGQVQQAVDYYEQALVIAREIGDRRNEGTWLGSLGISYRNLGQVQRAVDHFEQALAIARETGDRLGAASCLGSLGNVYANLGQVQQAVDYYEQALTISQEIGDRRNEGTWLGNLGVAYADLGRVQTAIKYHEQALKISREIGDRRGEGACLGNLGNAYAGLGEVQQAIDSYDQALDIAREIGDQGNEGTWLGNLGSAYHNMGRLHQAVDYYEQALAINREIGHRRGEGVNLANLGVAYIDLERFDDARSCWEHAMAIFEEIQSPNAELVRGWLDELDGKS